MADNVALQANERGERGKNAARRLRASGMTPAILYAAGDRTSPPAEPRTLAYTATHPGGPPAVLYGGGGSTSLAVETRTLDYTRARYGDNALYDIGLGSGSSTARV